MTGRALLMSRERLVAEVAKCDVVCANCHAVRSARSARERGERQRASRPETRRAASQRASGLRRRDFLLGLRDRPCGDCGKRFAPVAMEFDHRDRRQKRFEVAHSWCRSVRSILAEAAKCDVVCRNCHRSRTFVRRCEETGAGGGIEPAPQTWKVRMQPLHHTRSEGRWPERYQRSAIPCSSLTVGRHLTRSTATRVPTNGTPSFRSRAR